MNHDQLLKNRDFCLLLIGDTISVLGDQIGLVSLMWFVMLFTGQSEQMGLVALCFGLPGVVAGVFAGTLLDRFSQKRVLIMANIVVGTIFMLIPLLYYLQSLSMFVLLCLVTIAGMLAPLMSVGFMVLIPALVAKHKLQQANSLSETVWQASSLLGPLAGGILIHSFGAPLAIFLNGLSFWICALFVLLIDKDKLVKQTLLQTTKHSFLRDTWVAVKYLISAKAILWITIAAVLMNAAFGQLEVSLPLFVHNQLARSAVTLGTLWMCYSIGAIAGSSIAGIIRFPYPQGVMMALMLIAWGLCFLPMAWSDTVWMSCLVMGLAGFFFAAYPPMARTIVQRTVPDDMQGRVFGVRTSLISLGVPTGSYLSGIISGSIAPSITIAATGMAIALFGVLMLCIREFRTV